MLEGDERIDEATALYERAAACQPMDAMEELHVAMARAELHEGKLSKPHPQQLPAATCR